MTSPLRSRWNAETYDAKFGFVTASGAPILSRLAPQRGERILDLGCGTGELTAQIQAGADVVGLDADANMVARAKARFAGLTFVQAGARIRAGRSPCPSSTRSFPMRLCTG